MLLHDSKLDNQHTNKLADKRGGPYVVYKVLDGGAYVLSELDGTELNGAFAKKSPQTILGKGKKHWRRMWIWEKVAMSK